MAKMTRKKKMTARKALAAAGFLAAVLMPLVAAAAPDDPEAAARYTVMADAGVPLADTPGNRAILAGAFLDSASGPLAPRDATVQAEIEAAIVSTSTEYGCLRKALSSYAQVQAGDAELRSGAQGLLGVLDGGPVTDVYLDGGQQVLELTGSPTGATRAQQLYLALMTSCRRA